MRRIRRLLVAVCLGLTPVAGVVAAAEPAAAAACTLAPTNGTVTKYVGFRSYELHVPPGLSGTQVPVVLMLHGGGGNGRIYEGITGLSAYADAKKNFILAYPNSQMPGFWDYGEGSSEVTYLKNVVAHIAGTYCVDPKRVFVTGHSNGGLMADRLACDAASTFAAFAPYAGSSAQASIQPTGRGGCKPSRAVPYAFFHGDSDTQAPIAYQQANRDWWLKHNGCTSAPVRSTDTYGTLDTYCSGGQEIWWRVYTGQSHAWPTGAKGTDLHDRMWQFFAAHPLP